MKSACICFANSDMHANIGCRALPSGCCFTSTWGREKRCLGRPTYARSSMTCWRQVNELGGRNALGGRLLFRARSRPPRDGFRARYGDRSKFASRGGSLFNTDKLATKALSRPAMWRCRNRDCFNNSGRPSRTGPVGRPIAPEFSRVHVGASSGRRSLWLRSI